MSIIGHQLGNFHNYYIFHSAEDRLRIIPDGYFQKAWMKSGKPETFYILDIGCNDGTLSYQLIKRCETEIPLATCYLVGIDIDYELIERAKIVYKNQTNLHFTSIDITSNSNRIDELFSIYNVENFHVISLFSITMWIHLNHGDDGLKALLRLSSHSASYGLIIEPQPWKCYKVAAKRCRKLNLPEFPYPSRVLKIRDIEEEIKSFLQLECNMIETNNLDINIWNRLLLFFEHIHVNQVVDSIKSITNSDETFVLHVQSSKRIKGNDENTASEKVTLHRNE
jgi:SAM-dependent methyltransferase